ncbi:hypothetical protein ABZ069_36740 [Streptomyces microflavus]|uniref:hypothetical protein n=1 Tax=Streptomyces microflavus TaxID=1919 RepID=UPI0033B440E0
MDIIPLANGLLGTAITIASEVGGKFKSDVVAGNSYNNIPPHFMNSAMAHDATVTSWEISAAWFTHTRLYHLAEAVSPVGTGRELAAHAEYAEKATRRANREEIQKSHIVATQYPFIITFDVVSYMPRDRGRTVAEGISSTHRGVSEYQTTMQESIKLLQEKLHRTRSEEKRKAIGREIKQRKEAFVSYTKALHDMTNGLTKEAVAWDKVRHNICNFRIRPKENVGSLKRYTSAGLSVESRILVGADWDGDLVVELDWNERAFLDFAPFGGQIRIGLDGDGVPSSVRGEGKFYDRFLATQTGMKIVKKADPNIAVNRETIAIAASALGTPTVEERKKKAPVPAPKPVDASDAAVKNWASFAADANRASNRILHDTPVGGKQEIFYMPGSPYVLIGGKENRYYLDWRRNFGLLDGGYVTGRIAMIKHGIMGKVSVKMEADRRQVRKALASVTDKQVGWAANSSRAS